jgi:hypothetical protein
MLDLSLLGDPLRGIPTLFVRLFRVETLRRIRWKLFFGFCGISQSDYSVIASGASRLISIPAKSRE